LNNTKKVMIVAGEASGDLHGANLVKAMKQLAPNLQLLGMGGKQMAQVGVTLLTDISDISVCGFIEILRYLPKFHQLFTTMKKALRLRRPDLLILVDYPTFNLKLAKFAHSLNIKILYYISPQIWAWHTERIHRIKRYVTMMAVIFPFETEFYRQYAMPVKYVGHPLLEILSSLPEGAKDLNNPLNRRIIGLLPGSRNNEIKYILPTLLDTAHLLKQKLPDTEFLLPLANTIKKEEIAFYLNKIDIPITIVQHDHYAAMRLCEVVIAASGTVTLELALLGVPMVIVYKGNPLSFMIAKRLVKIPYVGLCNIIAGKKIVAEFIQKDANPAKIFKEITRLLEDKAYSDSQKRCLAKVTEKLRLEKECTVAELVVDILNNSLE
jgi:lipid-A-disaccharide synthase